jgi:DNA-binding beta-propeller fold protein YncE
LFTLRALVLASATLLAPTSALAELPALLNYESKPEQTPRREGLAIIELDPDSPSYGKVLRDLPLPPNFVAHHIFYNPDQTKAYITSLGKRELRVMDLTRKDPFLSRVVPVPDCEVGENVIFSKPRGRWYLTCMGSSRLIAGDLHTDEVLQVVDLPAPWPHGLSLHEGIDRILVTSTINPADIAQAGEEIVVLRASTLEVLSRHKVSHKPGPSGAAPVEVLFVPGTQPPLAYITNMYEGTLWMARWQPETQTFAFEQLEDFGRLGQGVPLEMFFSRDRTRLYVTTASPGHLNIFDMTDPRAPRHLRSIEAAAGAHHVLFSHDEKRAYVQNSLLNLPGLSDGSVSVLDLERGVKVESIDTLKNAGFNPNCIIALPGHGDGHSH